MTDANGHAWRYEYDASGRRTATVHPDGTRSAVEYDALGRKLAEIDQAGIRTEFLYDEAGSLTGVNDAEGGETRYAYDPSGNLSSIGDPNKHISEFTYDALGRRKTSHRLPEGMIEIWDYEDSCRTISHTDFNGATITFVYDDMNREVKRNYPDGKSIEKKFNSRNQIENVIYIGYEFNPGEPYRNRVMTYDNITGRLIRDDKEDGQFIAYRYDISGNLIETSYSGGHVVRYTHDLFNRLETVTDEQGTTCYTYDKVGKRKSISYPNGTSTTYEYNDLNRLLYLENTAQDGLLSSHRYTLGPAGNRIKITEKYREPGAAPGDIIEDHCEYEYDMLYRLTREARNSTKPERGYWNEYTYDPFGNRLELKSNGLVTSYSYDKNDRLLSASTPGNLSTTYTWDSNGNMTVKDGPDGKFIYQWDYENNLNFVQMDGQPSLIYHYDFRGERIYKSTPLEQSYFLIDNNSRTGYSEALREIDGNNNEIVSYTFGDDLINQKRAIVSYFHFDGLGSTRSLTSPESFLTDAITYYAFGAISSITGSTQTSHLFTGEIYDFNLGYYYLRARFYSPQTGTFTSLDDFDGIKFNASSLHKYLYTTNNPTNTRDPSGRFPFPSLFSIVMGILIWQLLIAGSLVELENINRNIKANLVAGMIAATSFEQDAKIELKKIHDLQQKFGQNQPFGVDIKSSCAEEAYSLMSKIQAEIKPTWFILETTTIIFSSEEPYTLWNYYLPSPTDRPFAVDAKVKIQHKNKKLPIIYADAFGPKPYVLHDMKVGDIFWDDNGYEPYQVPYVDNDWF